MITRNRALRLAALCFIILMVVSLIGFKGSHKITYPGTVLLFFFVSLAIPMEQTGFPLRLTFGGGLIFIGWSGLYQLPKRQVPIGYVIIWCGIAIIITHILGNILVKNEMPTTTAPTEETLPEKQWPDEK